MVEKSKRAPRRPSSPRGQKWNGAIWQLSKKLLRCSEKAKGVIRDEEIDQFYDKLCEETFWTESGD
jgi:hypothetical protein